MPTEIKQANMLKEIISNRKLIWDLSKNDLKPDLQDPIWELSGLLSSRL